MLEFVGNMKIFCSPRIYFGLKVIEAGYSSRKLQTTFRKFYGHTDFLHTCDTSVSHLLKGLFTKCDIWLISSKNLIVTGATCVAWNAHSFQNTWFHYLWGVHDCTHSFYTCIHYRICQFTDYVYGITTGLFAWISLTALFRTYFIIQ